MMNRPLPWDEITTPTSDYAVRLAAKGLAVPVFWGKNLQGQMLTIVELAGDHYDAFRRDSLVVRGIGIDLRAGETPGTQRLVLTLEQQIDADLFLSLCEALIAVLSPVSDSAVALSVTLAHLRRWKAFLAGKRTGLLTPEQVRGLLCELIFLRDLYAERKFAHREAVDSWTGADRIQQDFVFRDTAVEVKAITGRERSSVRISSEDQLETSTARLFLAVFRLAEIPDLPEATSLNGLVTRMVSELSDAEAVEEFQQKLASAGYAPVPDYDAPAYVASAQTTFAVVEGFPRLVRSALPPGVARVSYDLELETIDPFQVKTDSIFEVARGSTGQ